MLRYLLVAWLLAAPPTAEAAQPRMRLDDGDVARFDFCESRQANIDLVVRLGAQAERAPSAVQSMDRNSVGLAMEGSALAASLPDPVACREALEAGRELHYNTSMEQAVAVRREYPYRRFGGEDVMSIRTDLYAQFFLDETARRVLAVLPEDPVDPAMRWARAQAETRMKNEAIDAVSVVSRVYEDFGVPTRQVLGWDSVWYATQLAERHGVPVAHFISSVKGSSEAR